MVGLFLTFLMASPGGGATLAGLLTTVSITTGLPALLGAGSAAGSLSLARRSEDKELLESGEVALGLTEAR